MPTTLGPTNNFLDEERDNLLRLMRGTAFEVLVGPKLFYAVEDQDCRSWHLSKAWLAQHSRIFERAYTGEALKSNRVILDADPDIFALFVEFMIRGQFTWRDDLRVRDGIRESAKAWMLGKCLEAPKFQKLAMRNLFNIYKGKPRSGLSPDAIEYVCENCTSDTPLFRFFQNVIVVYWTDKSVVVDNDHPKLFGWNVLWAKYPSFRDVLLERLSAGERSIKNLDEYLVIENDENGGSCVHSGLSSAD